MANDSTTSSSQQHSPPEPKHRSPPEHNHILRIGLTISLLACFLLAFFSFYFCRYRAGNARRNRRRSSSAELSFRRQSFQPSSGLEPCIISSFPILTYSWVKGLQEGKYGQECAICLGDFADNDVLRLLTPCSHVFHIGCIDLWLKSHTTCPVCRRELNPDHQEDPREVRIVVGGAAADDQGPAEGARGDEAEPPQLPHQPQHHRGISFEEDEGAAGDGSGANAEDERRGACESGDLDGLPRSNSTGHSSRREDRFILRLPEDVKERICRERNWTGSCISLRELLGDHVKDGVDVERSGFSDRAANGT
ncbi:hypothetical protein ACLOJK_030508 [Asimina triloba]